MPALRTLTVFIAPFVFAVPAARAQATYQVTPLPSLDGHPTSAIRLNARGDAAGSADLTQPGDAMRTTHPALFPAAGGVTDLGLVPGAQSGFVRGMNDRGDVTIEYRLPDGTSRAYFTSGGAPQPIPLPAGANSIRPAGIDNAGRVVGTFFRPDGSFSPFLYDGGTLTPLAVAGGGSAGAASIIAAGQVLGNRPIDIPNISGVPVALLWQGNGVGTDVTPPGDWKTTSPGGLNDLGHVAGDLGKRAPVEATALLTHPYLYRDGVVTDLGPAPGAPDGITVTRTYGLNNQDDVVGTFYTLGDVGVPTHGFLYSGGRYTDLSAAVSLPDGYRLVEALAINDARQILVSGTQSGTGLGPTQSFLLTPLPEPTCAGIVAAGASMLLLRRRQMGGAGTSRFSGASIFQLRRSAGGKRAGSDARI